MAALVFPPDPKRVQKIFARFETLNPKPLPELEFRDPYTLLVAVVLSAQATDVSVNKATRKLYAVADTPQKMVKLGEARLIPFISAIGLFNTKAKNVIALSRIILEQHAGQVPLEREPMQALPGVGRKTASVVLNELGVEPAIAVDTHVYRVSHRLELVDATTPEKVERQLMQIIPERFLTRAHHWLILHGRYICTAQRPKCATCPIADLCPSRGLFDPVVKVKKAAPAKTVKTRARPKVRAAKKRI
ncbi:MAG TPA: endonuclease III [Caulobacteraceae bacterium]|jgi:endonuclease-3|nr:endonuclease III [Caulobacteraceae bacterium]